MLLLRVDGAGNTDDQEDLLEWLREEPELQGRVQPVPGPVVDGALGTATDLIAVAIGSGGLLTTVLSGSLQRWLAQPRPRRSGVKIKISREGSKEEIEVEAARASDVELLLRSLADRSDHTE